VLFYLPVGETFFIVAKHDNPREYVGLFNRAIYRSYDSDFSEKGNILPRLLGSMKTIMETDNDEYDYSEILEKKKIITAQRENDPPTNIDRSDEIWVIDSKIWIPTTILLVILWSAHRILGHPGINTLISAFSQLFYAKNILEVATLINKECLICIGEHLPRLMKYPLGRQLFATAKNEIIHMDYLYMQAQQYLLVMRDDFTGKTHLVSCQYADSISTVNALLNWRANYGWNIYTDGGSHFVNQVVKALLLRMQAKSHVTVAFSPWANGKAERQNLEVLRLFRIMLNEFNLAETDWALLLPLVQFLLNNLPRRRLNQRTSDEAFLGSTTPLLDALIFKHDVMLSVDPPSQTVIENSILALQEVLDNHRKVIMARQATLRPEVKVFHQQFGILDFVLVAKTRKRVHKLESYWTGPAQVISTINPWVYGISYLSSSRIFNVHVSRLRKYDNTL
jgi:hypothetical protein